MLSDQLTWSLNEPLKIYERYGLNTIILKLVFKRLILCETPNRGKQLCSVCCMTLEDNTFQKQTPSQRLA